MNKCWAKMLVRVIKILSWNLIHPCAGNGIVVATTADDVLSVRDLAVAVDEHVGVVSDLLPDGKGETLLAVDGIFHAPVPLPGPARVLHALYVKEEKKGAVRHGVNW